MTGHWDAAAIALIASVVIALLDRAFIRALKAHRRVDAALRAKDRREYRRRLQALRQLHTETARPVRTQLMDAYICPTFDGPEPIPYALTDRTAYLPVFTEGGRD